MVNSRSHTYTEVAIESLTKSLTHCGLLTLTWVNLGAGNGLLPDSTDLLYEPRLTYHEVLWHLSESNFT